MGDGPSGGDNEASQVNTSAGTQNLSADEVEAMAEEEASKGYSSISTGNADIDAYNSMSGDSYSYTKPAGNWKNAGTKTVTQNISKTAWTDAIMNSANPQASLYDYSNKVRSGEAGKISNKELNALEAAGLDTFGMGLRGTEMFGGKMGHDDYGTPMSRANYRPEILNQGGDPTDEAQRVNNPAMAGLVGAIGSISPLSPVIGLSTAYKNKDKIANAISNGNMMEAMSYSMLGGTLAPADKALYDAGNYTQAMERSANAAAFVNDPNNANKFNAGQDDSGPAQQSPVATNLGTGGGNPSSGSSAKATPDYNQASTVTGYDNTMYGGGQGSVNAIVNYLSNQGTNRNTGQGNIMAGAQNFGLGRRGNLSPWNVGDQQNFNMQDWRNRKFWKAFS